MDDRASASEKKKAQGRESFTCVPRLLAIWMILLFGCWIR